MTKVIYLDEEQGWHSTVHEVLSEKYDLSIPESLPHNIEDIWSLIGDSQIVIADYRLNGDGVLSYTGDEVAKEIHKHNKHLPVFIITSFEDNAIQECTETQIIRGKEMFTNSKLLEKLCLMIEAAVNIYDSKKRDSESCIQRMQEKIAQGEELSPAEDSDRFDAELYLSELDLDSSVRAKMISSATAMTIDNMLSMAQSMIIKREG